MNIGLSVYSDCAYQKHNQSVNLATTKVLEARLNIGAAGRLDVMKELDISVGFYTKTGSGRKNDKRVKQANARAKASCQEKNRASNTLITLKQQVPTKIKL